MKHSPWFGPKRQLLLAAVLLGLMVRHSLAADPPDAAKGTDAGTDRGAAVTVLTAAQSCFADLVEVSGLVIPRQETAARPERPGLKVVEILAEPGDTVSVGQTLARLSPPEGGTVLVQAPVAGLISASSAIIGAVASAKGEALFSIIARGEFDVIGLVPTQDLDKLAIDQPARIKVIGAGEVEGRVKRLAPTVEPNSQLGEVILLVTSKRRLLVNASARAVITTSNSCNHVAVPLQALLYGSAGTVVQVVRRDHVETRRVEIGLRSGGLVEIREGIKEGDLVVVRAGALLREGDPVRPVTAANDEK